MIDGLIAWATGFESLEALIAWGGILLVAAIIFAETGLMIGFFLPGDSLLFTTGLLVATDILPVSLSLLMLVLCCAAILGDQVGYSTGRFIGARLFTKKKSALFNPAHVKKTHAFYERYGAKTIVIARFVPIVRTFAPIVAGVGKMAYREFLAYNVLGGVFWIVSLTSAGYFLGGFSWVQSSLEPIIFGIIALSLLPIAWEWYKARRARAA